jgi:hypothetical protein
MCRRCVRRTIAALVVAVALMLAGAGPASAVELGFVNGLVRAWSAVAAEPEGLWERLAGWLAGTKSDRTFQAQPTTDMGPTSDPNGLDAVPANPPGTSG